MDQEVCAAAGLSLERLARIDGWMDGWVNDGRIPGMTVMISRRGRIAYARSCGVADLASGLPMAPDTIVRLYSMTKPLTSVATMMLYEEGRFQLDDPIAAVLPGFADVGVWTEGGRTVPAERPITYRDLLTHTAGLTYHFVDDTPVGALYRERGLDFLASPRTLEELVDLAASLPLVAHPGTAWNYSIAADVLGHLVALHSGMPFDAFLRRRIIEPLGMVDTDFHVPAGKRHRFAGNHKRDQAGQAELMDDPPSRAFDAPPPAASGGGGLVGTAADYMRFCRFLLDRGRCGDRVLLGRKTVELMTANHLPGDMAAMGQSRFGESTYRGIGFGLGFSVMLDPAKAEILGSPGEVAWGGIAGTAFWVDPREELAVVLLTQLTPAWTYPLRRELRVLSYAAISD